MDFSILYALQSIRTEWLDSFMLFITSMAGDMGQAWVLLGILLLVYKKTRKLGLSILLSYAIVYFSIQYGIKDLIARPRPCHIDQTIEMITKCSSSFSCPSTHTCWAFAGATCIYLFNSKAGKLVYVVTSLIALSRMYLFVHFPTDVLFGLVLGVAIGFASYKVVNLLFKSKQ